MLKIQLLMDVSVYNALNLGVISDSLEKLWTIFEAYISHPPGCPRHWIVMQADNAMIDIIGILHVLQTCFQKLQFRRRNSAVYLSANTAVQ
jgi:hypothetical protein